MLHVLLASGTLFTDRFSRTLRIEGRGFPSGKVNVARLVASPGVTLKRLRACIARFVKSMTLKFVELEELECQKLYSKETTLHCEPVHLFETPHENVAFFHLWVVRTFRYTIHHD